MNRINGIFEKILDISFFKMFFLIACFFYSVPLTSPLLTDVFKLFIFWGIVSFGFNYFYNKKFVMKKIDYLLLVFLLFAVASCLVNYKNNLVINVIAVMYLFVQTVMMVAFNSTSDIENKLKEIKQFSNIVVGSTFVCSVLSILIFLFNFKYSYAQGFQQIVFGVYEGRLWGIQGNPNSLAQFGLISIWLSIVLIVINNYSCKRKVIYLYLNIIVQVICCVLSNSRSTILGVFASLTCFAILMISYNTRRNGQSVYKAILNNKYSIIFKLLVVVVCAALTFPVVKQGMIICASPFENINLDFLVKYEQTADVEANNTSNSSTGDGREEGSVDSVQGESSSDSSEVQREYSTGDYSNGRFEIWRSAIEVVKENPFFGVGAKNVGENLNKYLSEATVSATPKLSENTHNIYIQVLVSHGGLAFIVFIVYLLYQIYKSLKVLLMFNGNSCKNTLIFKLISVYFSLVCSLLVINLFDSNILYFCSIFLAVIFWTSISNINSLIDCLENETEKKEILFVVDSLETGGTEKVLIDLTSSLDYDKYNIHVKTIYNEGKYIEDIDKRINYSYVIKNPNIWSKRIFYRMVKYLPTKLLYQLIISEKYDVEIAFHELLSTKIMSGSHRDSLKVAWIHTNVFFNGKGYQMFLNYKLFVKGYNSFDKIICVSDNIRNSFNERTFLNQKTETIYNPIKIDEINNLSKEKCALTKGEDSFLVVTIGRLEKVKGYDKLLWAFNELKRKYNGVELWILGNGSEIDNYRKFIKNNDLEAYVKFPGFQSNPYNYLEQADVFISTSEVEGFSLAVAEAIALGLPVISTCTDGPTEILENGKYGMLIPHDKASILEAIERVMLDKVVLNDLRKKSNERRKYFEQFNTIDKFDELINCAKIKGFGEDSEVFCTVFTPTYNRAYILDKLYESLKSQTDMDFEWVVVDDGSSDNTEQQFEEWIQQQNNFKIKYVKIENNGKQNAINKGLDLAKGKMFFIVDSDDYLTENAIEKIKYYVKTIDGKECFAGVSGLKGYTKEAVIGSRNDSDIIDCTNLKRKENKLLGDKAEVYYTKVLKAYKFPKVENEKFITECVVWDKIAYDGYKIRWFNNIITICNYLEDGLTYDGFSLYKKNPIGYLIYLRNESLYYPFDVKRKMGNYYRYYKVVKDRKNLKDISNDLLTNQLFLKLIILMNKIKK